MSLRTGIGNFFQNVKSFGLRTGTSIKNAYTQARAIAHKVKPNLEKGTRFIEDVNTRFQYSDLGQPHHRKKVDTWTRNLRNVTDKYNVALTKADLAHDIVFPPGIH